MMKKQISAIMTRGLGLLLAAVLLLPGIPAAALYDLPEDKTVSGGGILLASLGGSQAEDVILFEKDADARIAPSTLLRVMTTVVALEIAEEKKLDIDQETGIYTSDLFYGFVGNTGLITANMELGEEWTIRDLIQHDLYSNSGGCSGDAGPGAVRQPERLCGADEPKGRGAGV